jgi:hypothetical protein
MVRYLSDDNSQKYGIIVSILNNIGVKTAEDKGCSYRNYALAS